MKAVDFYNRVEQHLNGDMPFVIYRKPGEKNPVKSILQEDREIYCPVDFSENGFVFSPFDAARPSILFPVDKTKLMELSGEEKTTALDIVPSAEEINRIPDPQSEMNSKVRETHVELVRRAVKALNSDALDKVVLSRREKIAIGGFSPLQLFQQLERIYPDAFVYSWYHPKVGCWLGATPETLLEVEGLNFKTMALAGTQKYQEITETDWGDKEKQEQQYVTDSILDNLNELNVLAELETSAVYTVKAGSLLHLRTDIQGKLNSLQNLREIIFSLHPTPAVGGLPKKEAIEYILSEEKYDREFYTGFLGELNLQERRPRARSRRNVENLAYAAIRKKTSLFVNLRCMKLEGHNAIIYVGGGITKDSVAEDEWQETVNKSRTMKKVLGIKI